MEVAGELVIVFTLIIALPPLVAILLLRYIRSRRAAKL